MMCACKMHTYMRGHDRCMEGELPREYGSHVHGHDVESITAMYTCTDMYHNHVHVISTRTYKSYACARTAVAP